MSLKINKIYTDNPYVDEMVYYTKLMGIDTVLKMEDEAHNNETVESLNAGGLYVSCVEGTAIFEEFNTVSVSALNAIGIVDPESVSLYTKNKSSIPKTYRARLTKVLQQEYVANYEELNPYYRMLHGLPKIGHEDYVTDWVPSSDLMIDIAKPIHMMTPSEVTILRQNNIIDTMIEEDPQNRQYMRYLSEKKIDYYLARRANRFDILYIPKIESDAIYRMYKDKLDENKFYVLRTVYSEAYKYNSDYYDNFIAIFIVIITMVDIITRVQEFIARKEIFDIRSIQYIFKSYGVPFFEEIPLKYQTAMVKNLHTLLKYKSTSKCMIDICSLFGFDNIKIFKYYLLKDRKIDISTGEFSYSENDDEIYELKFLKLPLEDDLDAHIKDRSGYVDYDEITLSDPKWDGDLDHDYIIKEILKNQFNFTRTKYMSIDTIYEIAKMSAQQSYFFNFLYDNVYLESELKVTIPYINTSSSFVVADVFTLLTILTYIYNGVKDMIMDTHSKILYVNGFNFKADLAALAADISNKKIYEFDEYDHWSDNAAENDSITYPGSTLHAQEQLRKFIIPKTSIPSFSEMMDIYINNMSVRDELIKGMNESDNKTIYDVYKKLYDALMVLELTMDYYKDPDTEDFYRDEEGDATYSEYLKHRDADLYSVILQIEQFDDKESKTQYIANVIDSVIYALEEYIDSKEFQSLFSNLPIMSIESVKQYISTVINFYKSYKIDFLGINTIYTLEDLNEGVIRLIDNIKFHRYFERPDFLELKERIKDLVATKEANHNLTIVERIYFDIYTWVYKTFNDNLNMVDSIYGIVVSYLFKDGVEFDDKMHENVYKELHDELIAVSSLAFTSTYDTYDDLGIRDKMWIIDENEVFGIYMTEVPDIYAGRVLVSSNDGTADASSLILEMFNEIADDSVLSEGLAEQYIINTTVSQEQVIDSTEMSESGETSSDDTILSEKAVLSYLTINTLDSE